ncbi:MAG: hypothetical protein LUF92_15740 [Clostridiales bacterium]|nr:hypothetical protein [Clostridiales bacterium]
MATSSFDRPFVINDEESLKKLIEVMSADPPKDPLSEHPFSDTDRERGEALLNQFLSRSGR